MESLKKIVQKYITSKINISKILWVFRLNKIPNGHKNFSGASNNHNYIHWRKNAYDMKNNYQKLISEIL